MIKRRGESVPPNLRRICNFQISLSPREIRLVFVAALDENVKTIRALALSLSKKKKKREKRREKEKEERRERYYAMKISCARYFVESADSQIISHDKQAHGPLRLLINNNAPRHKAAGINYSARASRIINYECVNKTHKLTFL